MKSSVKKALALILATLILTLLFTGCGTPAPLPASSPTTAAAENPAVTLSPSDSSTGSESPSAALPSPDRSSEPAQSPLQTPDTGAPPPSQSPSVSTAPVQMPNPVKTATAQSASYPMYLPMPYYRTFYPDAVGVGNIDQFLHDAAVNYYSTRVGAKIGDLLIPSLRLLDTWDAGNGATYYLCFMAENDYYGLAATLAGGGSYDSTTGSPGLGGLIRFKVTPISYGRPDDCGDNYWGFKAVEIVEQWSSFGGADDYKNFVNKLCDNRPIAKPLIDAGTVSGYDRNSIPYIRDILPSAYAHDKAALLKAYLSCYFPDYAGNIIYPR